MTTKQIPIKQRYAETLKPIRPAPMLTKEQDMLLELFGGRNRVMFGNADSQCMPEVKGDLMPNRFNEQENLEPNSQDLFGLRKKFRGTADCFGLSHY